MLLWLAPAPVPQPPPQAAEPDPLSSREREVAILIAEGFTNRQIGAALVLSERTVDAHHLDLLAVGPGRLNDEGKRIPLEVKMGDRILMGKYAGTEVKLDGEECLILREDDVLAVLG